MPTTTTKKHMPGMKGKDPKEPEDPEAPSLDQNLLGTHGGNKIRGRRDDRNFGREMGGGSTIISGGRKPLHNKR